MGMGGYRSTHLGRPTNTSQNRLSNQDFNQNSRQPLQFHPTKLEPRPQMTQTGSSQSPLRATKLESKSRSRGILANVQEEEDRPYNPREPSFSYNPEVNNVKSISPYRGGVPAFRNTGGLPPRKNSPLRGNTLPSSREELIKPQAISNNYVQTSPDVSTAVLTGPPAREQLYRDRIDAMTIDNSSLQRRLNQVGSELDRIT